MTTQADGERSGRDEPAVRAPSAVRTIDAHQHFWRIDRADYGWLTPALPRIYRDFLPADLAPILARRAVDATILVQAAPTIAETRWLLDLAARAPFVAGVVGWAPFEADDAPEQIAALATNPHLVGLRPMVQDESDDDWLIRPALRPAFDAMIAHGLVFDALVLPRHLPRLARVLERHPELPVVVDHGAKPRIRDGDIVEWRADIAAIAAHPHVVCKLSGLVTEAPDNAGLETLRPCIAALLELFGPQRLLWGSDWPVVECAGGYDRWHDLALEALSGLTPSARDDVFGGNAVRVYLDARRSGQCAPGRPKRTVRPLGGQRT
jgi:L-fuconolactonase